MADLPSENGEYLCPECGTRAAPFEPHSGIRWPGMRAAYVWTSGPLLLCALFCIGLIGFAPMSPVAPLAVLGVLGGVFWGFFAPIVIGLLRDPEERLEGVHRMAFILTALLLNVALGTGVTGLAIWLLTPSSPRGSSPW